MSFTEKMQVASLVLEYAKVALGYPVTIPVLILALCLLFRERIGLALDALQELTFPGGGVKLRERAAVQEFREDIERTKEATAYATVQQLSPQPPSDKAVEAIASFFALTARLLPLVPKAERHRFIEAETTDLPREFTRFREALFQLADRAPEVHSPSSGVTDAADVKIGKPPTPWERGP